MLIDGVLYRQGYMLPFLQCLDEYKEDYVLREIHEGIYENYLGVRTIAFKIVR